MSPKPTHSIETLSSNKLGCLCDLIFIMWNQNVTLRCRAILYCQIIPRSGFLKFLFTSSSRTDDGCVKKYSLNEFNHFL